ncbi:MAG TPA: hypothetical protein VIG24_12815 [Acidimicrobiia bacterium]
MADREDRGIDEPEGEWISKSHLDGLQRVADAHARLHPKYLGTVAALRLLRIDIKRKELEAARAQREAAGYRMKVAEAELILCEAASRRGDPNIPTSIEARPLRAWLDEERPDIEEEGR